MLLGQAGLFAELVLDSEQERRFPAIQFGHRVEFLDDGGELVRVALINGGDQLADKLAFS